MIESKASALLSPSLPRTPTAEWVGEMLASSNEIAVIALARDGTIAGWHGAAERLFGYRADEIVGRPFAAIFTQPDVEQRMPQAELEVARRTGRSEDDRWHLRKDGSRFWGSGVVNPHLDERRRVQGYVKVVRDRTDLVIRTEALRNRTQRLAQDVRREREAFATFVHELRNPLGPILNAALVARSSGDDDTRRRMLDIIVRQSEIIQRLLKDASNVRFERRLRLDLRPLVLQDALKHAVDAAMPDAQANEQQLMLVCPDAPITLEADAARLQQMVSNLLINSLKYTPRGGHVTVAATVEGDLAVIRVDDDGEGIADENLERVFEFFTREDDDGAVPGYGVGLAVVKQLARLHGGFIEARSPGKGLGSQFTLQLPLRQGAASG
ncbi:MAG TPA: PAS domain-containing sensor histidine kinase [Burkholderiaceae bacterium]|nr:PAS domain-containing sensor histidine kinase [Burkholderiaceae bacterium]